jgi:hypothetical protein
MKKVIAGYILALAGLFCFSLFAGNKMFSAWERKAINESRVEKQNAPDAPSPAERDFRRKKLRLSMSSFDLANGLTFKEIEDISLDPGYRLGAFLYLLASLWLVWGMRMSRSHP